MFAVILSGFVSAKINLPSSEDIKLKNGLTVRVINRPELPLFTIEMTFRAGSIYDPVGQEGLANLCNEMLMRGTKSRSAKQIAEEISFGGGTLSNFCGRESAGFTGEFLAENGVKGFQILSDILLNSAFANDELIKIRNRTVAGLESRYENPSSIATEKIFAEVLGNSRYAHIPAGNISAVSLLNRDDIIEFYRKTYAPDNCLLVVCGDIDKKTVKKWIERYLGDWNGICGITPAQTKFTPVTDKQILILDKQDATQTQIRLGNIGLSMKHPDYIPFETARTAFAGSFTSRLVNEIRVKRGLTYGVSMRSSRYTPGGIVYISTFTKNESVGEVLEIILSETNRIQTEAVPDSELIGTINYRTGLYPLSFETNDDLAGIYTNLWFYGLNKDHYEKYQENMRQMTPADIIQITNRYFPYENYRIVLVGKADEIKSQVEKFGPVTVKPLVE